MARGRGRPGMGEWVQSLGEQIGTQLGQIIARSVQRTLASPIDAGDLARGRGAKIALADPLISKSPPRVIAPGPASSPRAESVPDIDTESTRAMDSDVLERALRASRRDDIQNGSPPTQRFAAPPPAIPPDPAVWFAMLHGKQTGPMTRTDLEIRADEGELGPRTYVWCEGMDSWQRAKDVIELVPLFPQLPGPTPLPMAPAPAKSHPTPS